MNYVICDNQDRYLTALTKGKTRRGWSKHRKNAAVFTNLECAQFWFRECASRHTRTARIEEVK